MNLKMFAAVFATLLAAAGLLAPAAQPNPAEAARLNNLGCAYMNQQLFEKGLKAFQQAAELDTKLTVARLNAGIAFLNLQKIDEAKAALEEARKRGLLTVALLGYDGGEVLRRGLADFPLIVRSDYIPRIQEVQASIYHILREALEGFADA